MQHDAFPLLFSTQPTIFPIFLQFPDDTTLYNLYMMIRSLNEREHSQIPQIFQSATDEIAFKRLLLISSMPKPLIGFPANNMEHSPFFCHSDPFATELMTLVCIPTKTEKLNMQPPPKIQLRGSAHFRAKNHPLGGRFSVRKPVFFFISIQR